MIDQPPEQEPALDAFEAAQTAASVGRIAEAVGILRPYMSSQAANAEMHYVFGKILIDLEREEVASGEVYEPFRLKFPWGGFPFPNRDHFAVRKVPEAETHLRRALDMSVNQSGARALLALQLVQNTATVREGAQLAQQAVSETPEDYRGHLAMAILGLRQGNWQLGAAAASAAERLQPQSGSARIIVEFCAAVAGTVDASAVFANQNLESLLFLADNLATAIEIGSVFEPEREAAEAGVHALSVRLLLLAESALIETQAIVSAARCLYHAHRLDPISSSASRVAGILLFKCGIFELADVALGYAVNTNPHDSVARRYLALTQFAASPDDVLSRGDFEPAIEELLEIADTFASQLEFEKATELCGRAIAQTPGNLSVLFMLAQLSGLRGDTNGAVRVLEDALVDHPGDADLEGLLANMYLAQARLAEAWPLFESRLRRQRGSTVRSLPPELQWSGEALAGRSILIWREEGIGDEIRFSSCLPDAVGVLDADITYECDARLKGLYARSFPEITVREEDPTHADIDQFSVHMPIGSLPSMFRRSLAEFPVDGAFLKADPNRVAAWRRRLDELGSGPKIGAGWRSLNPGWHKLPLHSDLSDWKPIADVDHAHLISLQSGLRDGEIEAAAAKGVSIHRFDELDMDNDIENAAALMSALDAVVSCQCWLLHLGGALGVKVYTFNAKPNPYLMDQDMNPWAPSVEVIYREYGATWEAAMMEIADRLCIRFAHRN
mgnify:CR=1 FL=1